MKETWREGGAATNQSTRARKQDENARRPSVAELQERAEQVRRRWSFGTMTVAGGAALYAWMFVACL